uniref:Translocase of inner mitochondrial membrane 10 homolog B (yeast) n=1 Tax=Maylandia zebra TaxID=106582 RepID=A0A3P9CUN6_9CICH
MYVFQLRDFLLVYNRMTEICFQRCSSNFNYRNLTMDEERCVDNCAGKLIRSNHRLMGTYVQLMPRMVQRRMEELESKAAENAKEEAASGAAGTEISATHHAPNTSSPLPAELDASVSSELKLSAATPLTPTNETLNAPVLDKAGIGPSYTGGFSQPSVAGGQIDSASSPALFTSSNSSYLSEDASKSESLSGQKESNK